MKKIIDTVKKVETAVLVALATPKQSIPQTQEYLSELAELARTAGMEPRGNFIQYLETPNPKTFIGSGKVEEIKASVKAQKINTLIFDDDLSPSQLKNIEKAMGCKVLDRSLLILNIFAMRAQTAQAKTQVELAQYQYLLPRLTRMWTHLSRQKGGSGGAGGMQGTGEKELETDRRIVKKKISLLKEKLAKIDKQASTQRKQRGKLVRVALVGYTNAGKSTLMRALSKENVYAEDKLFATLSATVRKVVLGNIPFLLSDTVGFIRKLPHTLIECFKSTLAEVQEADFLLHVIDCSHPSFEEHIQVVRETLVEINAAHIPTILVFNKIDKLDSTFELLPPAPEDNSEIALTLGESFSEEELEATEEEPIPPTWEEVKETYEAKLEEPIIFISAENKMNIDQLRALIQKTISKEHFKRYPNNLMSEEAQNESMDL